MQVLSSNAVWHGHSQISDRPSFKEKRKIGKKFCKTSNANHEEIFENGSMNINVCCGKKP